MIKTAEIRICDICKKEVKGFAGSLHLEYSDHDYTGCGYPASIIREDVCLDCCRKLDKAITEVIRKA